MNPTNKTIGISCVHVCSCDVEDSFKLFSLRFYYKNHSKKIV